MRETGWGRRGRRDGEDEGEGDEGEGMGKMRERG